MSDKSITVTDLIPAEDSQTSPSAVRQFGIARMIQTFTLYRNPNPENDHRAEYYSLTLYTKEPFQSLPIFIRESHGFWDDKAGRPILPQPTFAPDEGYDNAKAAEEAFERHLWNRADDGFIHCYSKPVPWDPPIYRILQR
jgi:hypothetical protein